MTMNILTLDQLRDLCRKWQERLRLQHWDVVLSIVRQSDADMSGNLGSCRCTLSTALSIIKLLDPVDYVNDYYPYDMEMVLVHELLHLHFCPFDDCLDSNDLKDIMLERAIEHIARALVETKRKGG
ncbi:hypothetical protein Ga0466249_002249 [Sporomusaceae bacterium BoRhaA]|uniref:hypothetical protein n=1 Tax=Pelorhabdus rhamnosifermentans TaxID=2772457 RepID=UPI001C0604F8|nr:hypothetical protein [Pelorhabdus rhamnosifermentans]MBU2701135.1 hypothetical protein [Pelorhabdus rhamnosifermentans]